MAAAAAKFGLQAITIPTHLSKRVRLFRSRRRQRLPPSLQRMRKQAALATPSRLLDIAQPSDRL